MKQYLFLFLAACLFSIGAHAQTLNNLVISPSPVPMNGVLHVDYDLFNNTTSPLNGPVNSHVKVNGLDLGVMNVHSLSGALLPGQFVHISFPLVANAPNNFSPGGVIIIVWPSGSAWIGNSEGEAVNVTSGQ